MTEDQVVALDAMIDRRAGRYRDRGLQQQFGRQVRNPPTQVIDGKLYRRTGASIYFPFWHGYDGVGHRYTRTSPADVAYMAGRFRRQMELKGRLPDLGARKVDPVTGREVT